MMVADIFIFMKMNVYWYNLKVWRNWEYYIKVLDLIPNNKLMTSLAARGVLCCLECCCSEIVQALKRLLGN